MSTLKKYFSHGLAFVFFLSGSPAFAAKVAQVIVPHANVYLYPQASSNVISKLNRGDSITVSNLPTEGFYKVRLGNGDIGWVSGNDVLAGDAGAMGQSPSPTKKKKKTTHTEVGDEEENDDSSSDSNAEPSFRVLVTYGGAFTSLSSGPLATYYAPATGLNFERTLGVDFQFRMNPNLFWVVRIETFNADSGGVATTNGTTAVTQEITVNEIPVELGFMWSPISTHKFRFGFGAFLGGTVVANTTITQDNGAQKPLLTYGAYDLCGELAAQSSIGIGNLLGIVIEADYRYDKTGTQAANGQIHAGTPGFQINYSGIVARLGLELRF